MDSPLFFSTARPQTWYTGTTATTCNQTAALRVRSQHRGFRYGEFFVSNLDPDTRDQQLLKLFAAHDAVESVTIVI